ncbi:hypothetical protein BDQ17DRAFT_1342024 [Cyathus striatus]|nr:hypothetical protein BDQ17DRAFT_1342024 [Cyathus striatus]
MPPFTRIFINHLPATRRAYSSFFSSKPGGGRYFNSSKPAKSHVVATAPKNKGDPAKSPESPTKDSTEVKAASNTAVASDAPASASSTPSAKAPSSVVPDTNVPPHLPSAYTAVSQHYAAAHPVVSPKDFKLHQFFSLHRPLLLIHHPPSILDSTPADAPLITSGTLESRQQQQQQQQQTSPFDDILDGSVDADAEAARQLTRALTMNSAGAAMAWEGTLRRLGLDPDKEPERIGLQEQWDKDWNDVLMESTKRKRKRKMRKHKLKKRRRLTRASRQRS